jgi:hypothetical protein
VDELFNPSEIPRPRFFGSGFFQSSASAARRIASSQSPSAGVSFGMNASPFLGTFCSRISTGSIPSRRAASVICDSTAQDACGVPNPRNAVVGVVCESSARARTRAFGVRYGPQAA